MAIIHIVLLMEVYLLIARQMCGYFLFHETTQYYQIVNLTNKALVRIPGPLQLKDNIYALSRGHSIL